jgi:hypothetical protein
MEGIYTSWIALIKIQYYHVEIVVPYKYTHTSIQEDQENPSPSSSSSSSSHHHHQIGVTKSGRKYVGEEHGKRSPPHIIM